jgi:hypothetical protein
MGRAFVGRNRLCGIKRSKKMQVFMPTFVDSHVKLGKAGTYRGAKAPISLKEMFHGYGRSSESAGNARRESNPQRSGPRSWGRRKDIGQLEIAALRTPAGPAAWPRVLPDGRFAELH